MSADKASRLVECWISRPGIWSRATRGDDTQRELREDELEVWMEREEATVSPGTTLARGMAVGVQK